jgi:hypothetical protein
MTGDAKSVLSILTKRLLLTELDDLGAGRSRAPAAV